jgi:hypothetical protein
MLCSNTAAFRSVGQPKGLSLRGSHSLSEAVFAFDLIFR